MTRGIRTGVWGGAIALAILFAPLAIAEDGDWLVRTRLIFIEPDDDASGVLGTQNAEVESDVTIEVDATYFFTDRFAVEGILATASQEVTRDAAGGGSESLGSVMHAPATFTAQFHFNTDGKWKPYLGAGINYTIFYEETGALDGLDLDSGSFGPAGQVGVDRKIGENKLFNFDLKYVEIETDVDAGGTSLGTVEVNPLIVGVGFGFRL